MGNRRLTLPGHVARAGNIVFRRIIALFMILVLFFSAYALYDAWRLLHGASSERLLPYKPGNELGLEELMKINPDVCAWITVDDTNIDYPVVQGKDNMEYLDKDAFGEYSAAGSVFLDYRNSREFVDRYNILFGHHMAMGAMFSDVLEFQKKDFFEGHKTGKLMLPGDVAYPIEFFAYLDADGHDPYLYTPVSQSEEEMGVLLSYIKQEAVYYRESGITASDQIIALSTCTEAMGTKRAVLIGKIRPE
ncbi:MAG: class B sortase [Clostridia bacterium]|nr:class B sortase [Clostridia bacterium]